MSRRSKGESDALIESGMRMVRCEAHTCARLVPASLRTSNLEEELVSIGNLRLVQLAPDYDPSLGSFVTYARPHVHWAMHRFAYRGDVPPEVRLAHLHFQRAERNEPAEVDMNETPAIAEARAVDWARRELAGLAAQWAFENLPPDEKLEIRETQTAVRAAIGKVQDEELTPEERWFVDRFYAGGATFVDIAAHLDCHERTVRRMRRRIEELFDVRFRAVGVEQAPLEVE